jgi:GGDEF domain-containing protein
MYYWTDEIPVVEDAREFEKQYEAAEKETDSELKLHLYVESAHMYMGDFLPEQTRFVWVAQEDRRYRAIFCQSVEKAVALMREKQAYLSMEALGKYAASRQPFADWETIIMEALISMERYDEATRLYEDTVAYYMEEMGTRPSLEMMELLDQMTDQINYQYAFLDDIQEKLSGKDENELGGYYCSYPVFRGIYRMIERIIERGGQSVYLMLCTLVDKEGTPITEAKQLDRIIGKLGDVICGSIRQSDAVCRYGKNQYLVLLVNTTRENCAIVEDRIDRHFLMDQKRVRIRYHVNSLADTEKGSRS